MNVKKRHDIKVIRNIAMFRIIMRHCFAIYMNLTKGIPVIIPSFIIKKHLYFRIARNYIVYVTIFTLLALLKETEYTALIYSQHPRLQYFQHWFFRLLIGSLSILLTFSLLPRPLSKNKFLENISSLSYKLYITHQFILMGLLGLLYSTTSLLERLYQHTVFLFPLSLFVSYCLHNKPTTVFPLSKDSYTKASLDPTIYDYSDITYHQ